MPGISVYWIEVKGRLVETIFNASSPVAARVCQGTGASTALEIKTDQSGFIGFVKYLHAQGLIILFARREEEEETDENKNRS